MRRQLIIVFGVPGAGKSRLAGALASELRCMRFDKDFISDVLRDNALDEPGHRAMAYRIMDAMIEGSLASAGRVIIEAPLMAQLALPEGATGRHPDHFAELALRLGAELKLIQLWCDKETLRARLGKRELARDASKLTDEGFEAFLRDQPLRVPDEVKARFRICEIDSCDPDADQLATALAFVRARERPAGRAAQARRASFGFKPPLKYGKGGRFSLVLWGFAVLFWLHRLVSPIQWTKFVARWRILPTPQDDIPPLLAELFTIVPIVLLIANALCRSKGIVLFTLPTWLIVVLLCWQIADVLIANLYYLMMRPMVEHDSPHNPYRSFVLGWFGFLELSLLLATLWFYVGTGAGISDIHFGQILGQVLKADSGIASLAATHTLLDIFSKATFGIMLTIILGRAISLVPPLPAQAAEKRLNRN